MFFQMLFSKCNIYIYIIKIMNLFNRMLEWSMPRPVMKSCFNLSKKNIIALLWLLHNNTFVVSYYHCSNLLIPCDVESNELYWSQSNSWGYWDEFHSHFSSLEKSRLYTKYLLDSRKGKALCWSMFGNF